MARLNLRSIEQHGHHMTALIGTSRKLATYNFSALSSSFLAFAFHLWCMPSQPCSLLLLSLNTSSHVIELSHALHFMCQICGIGIMSESVRFHTIILHVPDLWCGQGLPDSSTTNVGVADAHPVKI